MSQPEIEPQEREGDAPEGEAGPGKRRRTQFLIFFWVILVLIIVIGWKLGLDRHLLAALALLWGVVTQIFTALLAVLIAHLGAVPVLGPLVVKVVTLPAVLLINGFAFFASLLGIKIGHKRRVFESRVAATILMVGILIGYILGKLF